jgi:D-alanyl-D-alanine carboxypeptidase
LVAVWSVDDAINYEPSLQVGMFAEVPVSASAFMVFDAETGTEIHSKDSTTQYPIASLTKLATAALFLENADLEATTTILWSDVNTDGDAGRLHAYETYRYRELLYPLLLDSSNDAAAAMARVEPSLLAAMNAYATSSLGLASVAFADTSGLSDENKASAYDMAQLARHIRAEYPHVIDISQLPQAIGENTGWMNNNPFISDEAYRGGKHGYTYAADRTAAVFFEEELASGNTRTIGYVLLGSSDLKADMALLRQAVRANVRYQ